ncbi:AsnC family transcriptional regulator [Natronomonas salina]|uniref:Lrp/AsnC family transcriptional regulator n=1 Tax=Natronomonas salina TaxID=1710540 RepID=UPI0015B6A85C|nr:winged helix-turn-helix transcriptional regulator [Natronomonas salina]QLD89389.1 AsnC family transcriptional regulator [Natronomonas salina]
MHSRSTSIPLDDVDRAILQLLQRDARNLTAVDIADRVGVSDGTVRNRIQNLEARDVVEGYVPVIDYERAGYPLQIRIVCTAPIVERERLTREALRVEGVVEVHEVMTGRGNVEVKAVAPRHDDVTRVALALDEMGLDVESEELIRHHYFRPFNHFGTRDVGDEDAATHGI